MRVIGIAAVGRRGQIGINGTLPWFHDSDDLRRFRALTMGQIVVLGSVTFDNVFHGTKVWPDRMVLRMDSEKTSIYDRGGLIGYFSPGPLRIIQEFMAKPLEVWIAGGAKVYEAWRPFIHRWDITVNEYDGEADTWMPHLWGDRGPSPDSAAKPPLQLGSLAK